MFFPENLGDLAEFTSPHFPTKKPKPHQPADPIGKRYVEYFWHPFRAIIAPARNVGTKPAWRTIDYYLHPSQLWNLHSDKTQLVGIRFDNTTRYATIDLDAGGDYHNPESIKRIKHALEEIGIVDIVILQSSYSGGYHLIIPLSTHQPTFALACALELTLRKARLIVRQGHLEIFPNAKPYGFTQITNYKAIRCPMQPGSGSFLLDDDLQPISDAVSVFLDHCDHAARRQDLTILKLASIKAKKRIVKERYRKKETNIVQQWRKDWETVIATGWTDFGQTNTLLQIFVGYGIVFLDLSYPDLIEYAVEAARNAPGYTKYCRHQHEIEARVKHWVECTIRNQWYSPYASYPARPLGTFDKTFASAMTQSRNLRKPKDLSADRQDKVIPFDRRIEQNSKRSHGAQRRISWVVKTLEWGTGLLAGATERGKQICAEYKHQFGKYVSLETLHKHKHLWHPNSYILDPWAENSSNTNQISDYGHLDKQVGFEQKQNNQNPYQMDDYGHIPYMKVFCLPPAATDPIGVGAAAVLEQSSSCNEQSTASQSVENPVQLSPVNNFNSEFNDSSVFLNILQLNQNPNKDQLNKYFLSSLSGGAAENIDKQDLLIDGDNPDADDGTIEVEALTGRSYDVQIEAAATLPNSGIEVPNTPPTVEEASGTNDKSYNEGFGTNS
ncbi:MAG: hypothetical protein DSM106950_39975 [Stigonema ocellatum SAG 48.90 = DSM 106950]|nr:hypothetical protein [Stigonema ocellatum SAG 48.90 = DSM 106950]